MADHPVGVGQAPKTYLRAGMGLGPLKGYQSRDIPVGLATDGAASSSTLDLYEQMRLMAMTQKFLENDARAMPLAEILQIAFTGGARVLRQPELGELEPGKLADIVLLRQDRAAAIPAPEPGCQPGLFPGGDGCGYSDLRRQAVDAESALADARQGAH